MYVNGKKLDFITLQKRMVKKIWPELEGLSPNEYEVTFYELQCPRCKGSAQTASYKILSSGEWKVLNKQPLCSNCETIEQMVESSGLYRKRLNQNLTERCWFPPKGLSKASLKNYKTEDTVTKNALYQCVQYVRAFKSGSISKLHNLLIMGNPGTGKSHLSYAIAKYFKENDIGSVGFITTGKILAMIKGTYQDGASRSENSILKDIEKLDFLVIDDLGTGITNTDEFSWARKMIFDIVNSRLGKPTVYTTNFSDKSLPEVVGERVTSRLQENTKYINLFTNDYRKNFILK